MRRIPMTSVLLVFLLLAFLLLHNTALADGTPTINWLVLAGGGGQIENGSASLDGTVGQWVTGSISQDALDLCAGFRCGLVGGYAVYLPLVLRSHP